MPAALLCVALFCSLAVFGALATVALKNELFALLSTAAVVGILVGVRLFGHAETVWRLSGELAYLDRLRSVTADQVRLAARRYLDLERYGRLAFVPPAR